MALPSVTDARAAYVAGTGNAGPKWQAGAARTEVDPTQLAAAAIASGKAAQNYAAAGNRMQRGLAAAGKGGWLAGINRPEALTSYQAGTSGKGADKWGTAMNTWFPIFNSLQTQVRGMPSATDAQNDQRMLAWANGLRTAKRNL